MRSRDPVTSVQTQCSKSAEIPLLHVLLHNKKAAKHSSKLRFDYDLALHPAVADSATVAAVERVGSRCARHKLDHRRSSLLDLEAVFVRTEEEARITFRVRSVGVQIDLEAVRLIERPDLQLYLGPQLYADRRGTVSYFWAVTSMTCTSRSA